VAELIAVNVVHALLPGPKDVGKTAIDKRPRPGRVAVGELGLAGDTQCDTKHHGGPDQALYLYAREDADWWAAELGRDIPNGLFGENLDTAGLDVSNALIGERWRIGDGPDAVEVEVRSPRVPCITFEHRMGIPRWIKRFTRERRPGAYLKVLRTGTVGAGDPVTILFQPDHDVTVGHALYDPEPVRMATMLAAGIDLDPGMRRYAERAASRR
jgi:MOSC domain-containing protein YiiM